MSIRIESIKDTTNVNDLKYQDLKLDFEYTFTQNSQFLKKNEIIDLKVDYDLNAIKNSIRNMLLTNRGEKLLNPYFGMGLANFVFDQVTQSTAKAIGDAILSNITTFEPRVQLNKVNVIANEDDNSYTINIILSVPQLKAELVNLTGLLNNRGFNFA
jgi:phage baseplate assembly protein W